MFSASSGGVTANCYEVFYADIPYLRSVPSAYDEQYDPHYGTVTYYPASEVKRLIEEKWDITLSDDPGKWIKPVTQVGRAALPEFLSKRKSRGRFYKNAE